MGSRQAPDHRGSDLPVEGVLRPRAPPSQDPRWAADSPCSKGRSVHLWPADQRFPRSTTASLGRSVGLAHCTSLVLEHPLATACSRKDHPFRGCDNPHNPLRCPCGRGVRPPYAHKELVPRRGRPLATLASVALTGLGLLL